MMSTTELRTPTDPRIDEADIRQRLERYVAAIRAKDLERVMAIFARDLVSFDFEAPLQHVGADAKRKNWARAFAAFEDPLGYEIHHLTITVGGDVAFGHSLNRISGRLKNGNTMSYWVRWTPCFRKVDGVWLIAHDQVSVPADPESGKALLNLAPTSR
jgi:ketosteroid isomerase-like protein